MLRFLALLWLLAVPLLACVVLLNSAPSELSLTKNQAWKALAINATSLCCAVILWRT